MRRLILGFSACWSLFMLNGVQAAEVNCENEIKAAVFSLISSPNYGDRQVEIHSADGSRVYRVVVYGEGNCDSDYYFQVIMEDEGCAVKTAVLQNYALPAN